MSVRILLLLLSMATGVNADATELPYQIAFASFAPLDTDLFIADGDGSDARPFLSHPALDSDASFSRDGRWVIFTSRRDGSSDIYRAHVDGSSLERLVDDPAFDDQAALSPDGKTLAFVSTRAGQADVWLMDIATHKSRNLTQHPGGDFRPAWSPDGRWIAFTTDRDTTKPRLPANDFFPRQTIGIYLVRADGRDLHAVARDLLYAGSPVWSGDGKRLAFYSAQLQDIADITGVRLSRGTTQIEVLDLGSSKRTTLTSAKGEKWSPQWVGEKRLAFVSGGPEGGVEWHDTGSGVRGEFRNPGWSHDGKRMIFQREVGAGWPPHQSWPSLDPRFQLLRAGIFNSFSPTGDRRLSNDRTAGMHHNSILVMNAEGTSQSTLFTSAQKSALAPDWAPKGDWIAFALGEFFPNLHGDVLADIVVLPAAGGEPRVLTDGRSNYGFPSWSPDAAQIVYRESSKVRHSLRICDVATRADRTLIEGPAHYNFPAWSPTEDVIAFISDHEGDYEIYSIRPDGSKLTRLTRSPGNEGHLAWSRDGAWIAFSSARGGYKDEVVLHPANPQAYGDIYVMRADGTDQTQLTDDQFEEATPGWRPR